MAERGQERSERSGSLSRSRPNFDPKMNPNYKTDVLNTSLVLDMLEGRDPRDDYLQKMGMVNTNKKKSSFQITSISKLQNSEHHEGDADSMDDLDETHTEDVSSEVLDWSKTTDIEPDPTSPDDTLGNLNLGLVDNNIAKEKVDNLQSRFKVVKIASKEPFKRGRWSCFDFSDASSERGMQDTAEFTVPVSGNSSAASSVHYVPEQANEYDDPTRDTNSQFSFISTGLVLDGDGPQGQMVIEDIENSEFDIQRKPFAGVVSKNDINKIPAQQNIPSGNVEMYQPQNISSNSSVMQTANANNPVPLAEFNNLAQGLLSVVNSSASAAQNAQQKKLSDSGNNLTSEPTSSTTTSVHQKSNTQIQPVQTQSGVREVNATASIVSDTVTTSAEGGGEYSNLIKSSVGGGNNPETSHVNNQGVSSATGAPGATSGVNQQNVNVVSSNNDYIQNSASANTEKSNDSVTKSVLLIQQAKTTNTVTNSVSNQPANVVTTTAVDFVANSNTSQSHVPHIQVPGQSSYDVDSAQNTKDTRYSRRTSGTTEERDVSADNVATQTTKDDNQIESAEKTQLLLEQMVSGSMPAGLGSPVKDGDGDERHRRSPLYLMELDGNGLITDSESGSSTVAIDNKIEQAMDLVKSHLMFAVREEVEVLREQIKELLEQKERLEYENSVLKSDASSETLSKLAQPRPSIQPPTTSSS